MIDEVLQDNVDIEADLEQVNSNDIMKDFNFDDILEKPETVVAEDQSAYDEQAANQAFDENAPTDVNENYNVEENASETYVAEDNNIENYNTEESVISESIPEWEENASTKESPANYGDVLSSGLEESSNLSYLKFYDGKISDKMYEIGKDFSSDSFTGNDDMNTIHVNVGYDTYGWNVAFANGVNMSLRDVREYQVRQGCLPFKSGTITYKNSVLTFKEVNRIVVYESVKYFAYGA